MSLASRTPKDLLHGLSMRKEDASFIQGGNPQEIKSFEIIARARKKKSQDSEKTPKKKKKI